VCPLGVVWGAASAKPVRCMYVARNSVKVVGPECGRLYSYHASVIQSTHIPHWYVSSPAWSVKGILDVEWFLSSGVVSISRFIASVVCSSMESGSMGSKRYQVLAFSSMSIALQCELSQYRISEGSLLTRDLSIASSVRVLVVVKGP
jgi:hypothetical protein